MKRIALCLYLLMFSGYSYADELSDKLANINQADSLSVDQKIAALKADLQKQIDQNTKDIADIKKTIAPDPFAMQAKVQPSTCVCASMTSVQSTPKKMTSVKWVCNGNSCQQMTFESVDGVSWTPANDQSAVNSVALVDYGTAQSSGGGGGLFARLRARRSARGNGASASCGQ